MARPFHDVHTLSSWAWVLAVVVCPLQAQTLGAPSAAPVLMLPSSAQLVYDVHGRAKGLPYRGSARLHWTLEGPRYSARLQLKGFLLGTRTQSSDGAWSSTELQPQHFVDDGRRPRRTSFDWAQQKQLYQRGSEPPEQFALPPHTQDRLSVLMQLGWVMARLGAPPAPDTLFSLPVAGFGAAQIWTFRYTGIEALDLPAGTLTTWKLERRPREAGDTSMELWLSPELGHLPARLRLTEADGDMIDQRLKSR
jgi:hypothetical protein